MLTIVEYNEETHSFYAYMLDADAASGEMVFEGKVSEDHIREFANEYLCAPNDIGNYSNATVEWEGKKNDETNPHNNTIEP